jgi:hypothetical protein
MKSQIAENLHRVDLTKEQRDRQIIRYAELLEKRETAVEVSPQLAAKVQQPKKNGRPEGTASKIAKAIGLSKDTVQHAMPSISSAWLFDTSDH